MEQKKEYYAFISYKREDEKWAKWLQNKLEHYKFPTNLNGRTDLPKNIRPTFRDVTDLTPGLLAEEIDKALRSSEWLIVICSPRSAKSPWVCKEAQTFIDLGRADHIIPFVIEGNPFSKDSSTECYPEALLNLTDGRELLAANINEMGRDAAAIKVVARMFNLRFDILWQRHEREWKSKRNTLIAIFSFICLLGVLFYIHMRPISVYYSDFVNCNGLPKGIKEISEQIAKNRYVSYKFIYKRYNLFDKTRVLYRVEKVNSYGFLTNNMSTIGEFIDGNLKNTYPVIELTNTGDVLFYDVNNNCQEKWDYSTLNTIEGELLIADIKRFYMGDVEVDHKFVNERTKRAPINRICYKLDEGGYPNKITYHSGSGTLNKSICENNYGAYGYDLTRDSLHRIISLCVLNSKGELDTDIFNTQMTKYNYTDWGIESLSVYGVDGIAINSEILSGVHKVSILYDEYGNPIKSVNYGEDLNVCNSKFGYASQRVVFERGCAVESINYDDRGVRANNNASMSSKVHSYYDSKGRIVKDVFYDVNDNISPNKDGAAIIEYKYNNKGVLVSKNYFDENYKPTISKLTGYSILLQEVNSIGQVVISSCLGINGEKVINKGGFCTQKTSYNRLGLPCKFELYDTDDNLVVGKEGWAVQEYDITTDRDGNTIYSISVYGANKERIYEKSFLSHKRVYIYNEMGQCVEESHYDTNGDLCLNSFGFAKCIFTYDNKGRLSTRSFYDAKNKSTLLYNKIDYSTQSNNVLGGFAKDSISYISNKKYFVYRFNMFGELDNPTFCSAIESTEIRKDTVVTIYYDKNNNKTIANDAGCAIRVSIYDNYRRPINVIYFNEDSIRYHNTGISRMENIFDARGNRVEARFFNSNDSLINFNNRGAVIRYEYDNRNNEIKRFCLNEMLKPIMDETHGFALVQKYDNKDRLIENICIDTCNAPYMMPDLACSTVRKEYDIYGNIMKESYFNNNCPVDCAKGFHSVEYVYDKHHNPVEMRYVNSDNQNVSVNGIHCVKRKYLNGKLNEEKCYDSNNAYLGSRKYEYDDFGNINFTQTYYNNSQITQKEYSRLAIYENNNNNIYIIIQWEEWNITQPINNYLESLFKLNQFKQNEVLTYNISEDVYEYKQIDANSILNRINIPEYTYNKLTTFK